MYTRIYIHMLFIMRITWGSPRLTTRGMILQARSEFAPASQCRVEPHPNTRNGHALCCRSVANGPWGPMGLKPGQNSQNSWIPVAWHSYVRSTIHLATLKWAATRFTKGWSHWSTRWYSCICKGNSSLQPCTYHPSNQHSPSKSLMCLDLDELYPPVN